MGARVCLCVGRTASPGATCASVNTPTMDRCVPKLKKPFRVDVVAVIGTPQYRANRRTRGCLLRGTHIERCDNRRRGGHKGPHEPCILSHSGEQVVQLLLRHLAHSEQLKVEIVHELRLYVVCACVGQIRVRTRTTERRRLHGHALSFGAGGSGCRRPCHTSFSRGRLGIWFGAHGTAGQWSVRPPKLRGVQH